MKDLWIFAGVFIFGVAVGVVMTLKCYNDFLKKKPKP